MMWFSLLALWSWLVYSLIQCDQKYAKDSEEKADMLISLGVPISPTNMGGPTPYARGGPTEGRFDKV